MNADDIYKVIENAVEKTVPPVVERVVNGKIRRVQETLDNHMEQTHDYRERIESKLTELQPVVDFVTTFQNLNKFLKWGGLSFFAVVGFIYILIKKL